MLASLPVCPRSHCPTCCRHTHDGVHSHTRACSKAHLSMSSHMCPNYIDPQVPVVPTPGLSSSPFPSPTTALKLPITLPTTPTFISAHRQAPTCSSSLSSPFHTQARLFLLTPSLGLNALAFQCTHSGTLRRLLYRVSSYLDHETCVHTYTKQSQGMSCTSAGPSLPAMSTYYPALLRHTALGRSLLRPHSDTPVTPTGLCLPSCFPSSSLSSPCPPSSQNSPCVCGHRHLHRCHC